MYVLCLLSSLFWLRYQWILLKNLSAGEYSRDESQESLEKEATDLVNQMESQSGSDRTRSNVNGVEQSEAMRIVARISQVLYLR